MNISGAIFLFHLILGVLGQVTDVRFPKFEVTVKYLNQDGEKYELTDAARGTSIASKWILTAACIFYDTYYQTEEIIIADDRYSDEMELKYSTIKNYYILDPLKALIDHPFMYSLALVELTKTLDGVHPIDLFRGDTSWLKVADLERHKWHRSGSNSDEFVKGSSEVIDLTSGQQVIISNTSSLGAGVLVADEGEYKLCAILGPNATILEIEEHIPFIDRKVKETSENDDTEVDYEIETGLKTSSFQAAIYDDDDQDSFFWGTIVHLSWILTKAEFVHNRNMTNSVAIAGLRIIFDESNRQSRQCNQQYIPREYEQYLSANDESRFLYNFALVELTEPFERKAGVKPINILREIIPDFNRLQVVAYSWVEKRYGEDMFVQLAEDTVQIENQEHEGIKMLMFTVPLGDRIQKAYGYGVAYRGKLLGITGRTIGESHTIIAMQNGLLDFIDATIPDFAPKP